MTPAETLPSREAVSGVTSGARTPTPGEGSGTVRTEQVAEPSRLHGLHPGWFASLMGIAILAVATYDNPGNIQVLRGAAHAVGTGLAVVAYALAAVLLVAYGRRWARHRDAAIADLRHPALTGALYGTVPGGLLVLAVMTSVIRPPGIRRES